MTKPEETIMCIDPGNGGTGIAIWSLINFEACQPIPAHHKSISRKNVSDYVRQIDFIIREWNVKKVFIEEPQYMDSEKGEAAARKGDLVKLTTVAGAYIACAVLAGAEWEYISIGKWKGQLPKDIVKKRIYKRWPECTCTNHDFDAVGIAYHLMGML